MIVYKKRLGNDKLLENEIENNSEIKYATVRKTEMIMKKKWPIMDVVVWWFWSNGKRCL